MPTKGVESVDTIDLVGIGSDGYCVLIMVDDREWDGSQRRLSELQEKLNSYATYVATKRLFSDFPATGGKRIRIQLDCSATPDASVQKVLERAQDLLRPYGIDSVRYNVRRL